MLSSDDQGPRAVPNALDGIAGGYKSERQRVEQELTIAEAQLRDFQSRTGRPFSQETYLAELTALPNRLKAVLPGQNSDAGEVAPYTASGLAHRIKSLKAVHTIEARATRSGTQVPSPEEPIGRKIRRVQGTILPPEQADRDDGPDAGRSNTPPTFPSAKSLSGFIEHRALTSSPAN